MKIIFLGTGASPGVPMLGCDCAVCQSDDPKSKRLRASILVQNEGFNILIDTSTDLREQCLANGITDINAVLYTHHHADHILGLEELRSFNFFKKTAIPCFGKEQTFTQIKKTFYYIFDPTNSYQGAVSQVELHPIGTEPFSLGGTGIRPLKIIHGEMPILGYKFDRFAYVTDCSELPAESWEQLQGIELLILNALRYDPHPTHFHLEKSLETIAALKPGRALLTHMTHQIDHRKTGAKLPENVELAYDGMVVEL
ncbi:MAG: MBL fold metallo-hydrolase [Nitrospinota bacterium]|nr:MBL fold metallo-hydrolase [Nitrospinota bacterium]